MKSSPTDIMDSVKRLASSENFSEALELLEKSKDTVDLNADLLIKKGQLIKVDSNNVGLSLSDAKNCFYKALSIEKDFAPALLELGWHCLNVDDNVTEALNYFELILKKKNINSQECYEAYEGKVLCFNELREPPSIKLEIENDDRLCDGEKVALISLIENQ